MTMSTDFGGTGEMTTIPAAAAVMSWEPKPPYGLITFGGPNGETILNVQSDGRVELGPGVTQDEASREFWKFIASTSPVLALTEACKALDETLSNVPFTTMIRTQELAEPYRKFHEQLAKVCDLK
jgi:hypothetical protein